MADVRWIKILTDIFEDEKMKIIDLMDHGESILIVWFKIICLAGKSNSNGYLMLTDDKPYTDTMIAKVIDRDIEIVRESIKVFIDLGMMEKIDDEYYLPTWEKHQNAQKLEEIRKQTRQRMKKYRDKKKESTDDNNSVTLALQERNSYATDKDIEENKNKKESKEVINTEWFPEFWKLYPKKFKKNESEIMFNSIVKDEETHQRIIKDVQKRIKSKEWQNEKGKFIPHPNNYLNQKRWEDSIDDETSITDYSDSRWGTFI